MPSVVLLARPTRPRWRTPVAILFVVATVAGGLADLQAPAAALSASISGAAWLDADRDGVQGETEESVVGDTIWLFDLDAQSFVAKDVTDVDGTYAFSGLAVGTSYRIQLATADWWERWEDQVPTTTSGLRPVHDLMLEGPVVADFGWRDIVSSGDGSPITTFVGPSGLQVESFNDAVMAEEIHDVIATGALGGEARVTVVKFGLGGASTTSTSVRQVDGTYTSFRAHVHLAWLAWLTEDNAETLAHEYGHAWGFYHAYEMQQDPTMTGYLEARGLAEDDRVGSSYVWSTPELLAEDYQQLLGPPVAQDGGQMNLEILRAEDVAGLEAYLRDVFTQPVDAPVTSEPVPTSDVEPEPQDTTSPDVAWITPTDGSQLPAGPISVEIRVADDQTPIDQLRVTSALGAEVVEATFDAASGHFVATHDGSGLKGTHGLESRVVDEAGNVSSATILVDVVRGKGGGDGGKNSGACKGKKC